MDRIDTKMLATIDLCLGTLFLCLKGEVIYIALILLTVVLLSVGLMNILEQKLTTGLIEIGIGLISALFTWVPAFQSIAFYLLAILLILLGIYEIVTTMQNKSQGKTNADLLSLLVVPILCIIAGILLIVNAAWVFIVIGVLLLISGILNMCQNYIKRSPKVEIKDAPAKKE